MSGKARQEGDARLAAALARGEKVEAAAREAGVSGRTAFRRLRDEDFRRQVTEARDLLVRQVAGRLAGAGDRAVATLVALLDHSEAKVKLAAAKGILEHLFKSAEVVDMAARLQAVEDKLADLDLRREGRLSA